MCGICGIAIPKRLGRVVDPVVLTRMRDIQTHRGPDDAGLFLKANIGLGHRRLSIVDIAGGHQPMSNEDGAVHIVYNGEIYNHAQLRSELQRAGHRYASRSDTETIVHLYEERGLDAVLSLSGMFAFAIWDVSGERLVLARDPLGIKPLYYYHADDGTLYFGSEIKAILASEAIRPAVNLSALTDYFANYAPSGQATLFERIRRLPAGHTLVWQNGTVTVSRYWDAQFEADADGLRLSDHDYIAQWRQKFTDAVQSHLMSDVPLGVFLSGGIDSSAIAATMSRLLDAPFKTFSVGFTEREANELDFARLVARRYGTDHHEVVMSPDQYFAALPKMIWQEDEPLGHAASIPLYYVARKAAQHVKVVLTGEGSDELMAGYGKYRKTVYNMVLGRFYQSATTSGFRHLARRVMSMGLPRRAEQKLRRTFLWREATLEELYFDNFAVFSRALQKDLFTERAKLTIADLDPYREMRRLLTETDAHTVLSQMLYVDLRTYLQELLMKQDQMSMAASVESRVPFLDRDLVEFSTRMPDRMKLRGWTTKYVLREAMRDILPDEVLARPKMGFPVPVGAWFRGNFRHIVADCILGERVRDRGILDYDALRKLVTEHESGTRDHSQRLWSLVNLELWWRQCIDGESIEAQVGMLCRAH